MQVQYATQRVADTPDRLVLLRQVVQQFIDQALPVVIHRKAWIVPMLGQVLHLVVRRQGSEQLAVRGRGETVGMGEEDLLRHGAWSGRRMMAHCRHRRAVRQRPERSSARAIRSRRPVETGQ